MTTVRESSNTPSATALRNDPDALRRPLALNKRCCAQLGQVLGRYRPQPPRMPPGNSTEPLQDGERIR